MTEEGQENVLRIGRRCYVGNLSWSVSWQDLKDEFKQCGTVVYANVELDQLGNSKGWGIVEFKQPEEAAEAVKTLDGSVFRGRNIQVREDREDVVLKRYLEKHGLAQPSSSPGRGRGRSTSGYRGGSSNGSYRGGGGNNSYRGGGYDGFSRGGYRGGRGMSRGRGRARGRFGDYDYNPGFRGRGGYSSGGFATENREENGVQEGENGASSGIQVVVHGLPYAFAWQDLKDLFRSVGDVEFADIAKDRRGNSKGFGIVRFKTVEDAEKAITELNGSDLQGRPLAVKLDKFA
eukprot:TRINITY_DN11927_c0_g1_i1.p2 TRINITY_DN11927_c0_g1~~TRINITY_DN11927_c0_g1_i1.p2  ORF type:complete len:290 (-),score=58.79 TRINITY_DN11927_c0_g1_i1:664-1533(-)